MMHICGGLVGPKSENVEKPLVLPLLFEGSRGARGRQENEHRSGPGRFLMFFDVECFVYISRIVLPTLAGSTFSEKSLNKVVRR